MDKSKDFRILLNLVSIFLPTHRALLSKQAACVLAHSASGKKYAFNPVCFANIAHQLQVCVVITYSSVPCLEISVLFSCENLVENAAVKNKAIKNNAITLFFYKDKHNLNTCRTCLYTWHQKREQQC